MSSDALLIERIRQGEVDAWEELIARFEGRLLAFAQARLQRRDAGEDVVQETFIGFLTSLPNYDPSRPLEGYLFSIAAHKLTDYLRREGRRPTLPLTGSGTSDGAIDPVGHDRPASAVFRSGERRAVEAAALAEAIGDQIGRWREREEWSKVKCAELLFVAGWTNKRVAELLSVSEQTVANHKFEFLERLRSSLRKQRLSEDLFPQLLE